MANTKPTILIIGTLDTKLPEILFIRAMVHASSNDACNTKILDVSGRVKEAVVHPELPASELVVPPRDFCNEFQACQRGEYIEKAIALWAPVVQEMVRESQIEGIISAGGSSGSSLAAALMRRSCPIGFPKLLVSTMASGNIQPYIEETDITMMYSVVDIAGLNTVLRGILSNAAGAIVGMTSAYVLQRGEEAGLRVSASKRIAISMFGVTTPCVDMVRTMLTSTPHDVSNHEIYVFHATGAGGLAMERLIDEGQIDAVVDLTTTEIADELFGGVLTAGPKRLEAAMRNGVPTVVSVGACDMVNFGPIGTVPQKYVDRRLHSHTPTVTLMRTTVEENKEMGTFIASKLQTAVDPSLVRVLLPRGGVSMMDNEGQPFHDPEADDALFNSIKDGLNGTSIEVHDHPDNINTEGFAREVCEHILDLMGISPRNYRLANARRRQWSFSHGATVDAIRRASLVNIPDAD